MTLPSGSSPRVRGKLKLTASDRIYIRIIPARAGQTWWEISCACLCTDHPRACGANLSASVVQSDAGGSSPRVRGKRLAVVGAEPVCRIIPTRAGQTPTGSKSRKAASDHPRACGANSVRTPVQHLARGSSPRVRGKPVEALAGCGRLRIIPARAGQTRYPVGASPCRPDHPRACGANSSGSSSIGSGSGSSPRVRGKQYCSMRSRV